MRNGLVVAIIILFIGMSIAPLNGTAIKEIKSDLIKKEAPKELFNEEPILDEKGLLTGNPPIAEILYPENGSIVYTRYSNISCKCTDDTGLTLIDLEYGGDHYTRGTGYGIYPPSKIFYFNWSLVSMRPGYVWIVLKAFDEDGNIGIDTAIFYYDDTNDTDLYPPEIDLWHPEKGYIYFLNEKFPDYPGIKILNCSIVIGKFEIFAIVEDLENHLQKVEIYIDEEVVYEQEYNNWSWEIIHWNCKKLLIGMHEIKIVAIDSWNHSAVEKLKCFIINFI